MVSALLEYANNEEKLLVLASRIELSESVEQQIIQIIDEGFDVERFVGLAVKHKVLQLVSPHLIRLDKKDQIHLQYKRLFEYNYLGNKEKNIELFKQLKVILDTFNKSGIKAVPVKGVVLTPLIYKDFGLRTLNDLDFVIHGDDKSKFTQLLEDVGYCVGDYDWASDSIIQATRAEEIMWKMNAGNLFPHVKKVDNPFLKCVRVDFSYDVDLRQDYLATEGLLSNAVKDELFGVESYRFNTIDFLIHLTIHLYKEASNVKFVLINVESSIIKFCDLREYILSVLPELDWEVVVNRAKELHADDALYYSFYFLNYIYGDEFAKSVLNQLKDKNIDIIDRLGFADYDKPQSWSKSFRERFFRLTNQDLIQEGAKIDMVTK